MSEVQISVIKTFPISQRKLCLTDEAGSIRGGVHKDGTPLTRSFSAGAVAMMDADGGTAIDPVNFEAVFEFCERVIEGDARAITQPGALQMIAAAYLGVTLSWPVPGVPATTGAEV